MSLLGTRAYVDALTVLSRFRTELYGCLTARPDALFELADALLCTDGPVRTLVDLALAPEHRRGHGALYGGLNKGRVDVGRLRRTLAGLPLPKAADGRLALAVDVSPWLRPDAGTSPGRSFCHTWTTAVTPASPRRSSKRSTRASTRHPLEALPGLQGQHPHHYDQVIQRETAGPVTYRLRGFSGKWYVTKTIEDDSIYRTKLYPNQRLARECFDHLAFD